MADKAADIAQGVVDEYKRLSGTRGTFEAHWEECSRYVLPSYSGTFNANSFTTPGSKKTQYQYDSGPVTANARFAAVMESMLTPRSQKWQRVMPSDRYLLKSRPVRLWFEEVTDILFKYRYAPKANFGGQNHQNYSGLGAFGTGCMFTDKLDGEPGLRYKAIHLGEIYFAENHQGIIDRAIRRFKFTARQAFQKWGDKCDADVKKAAKDKPESEYFFLHRVMPNADMDPQRADHKGMAYSSHYVCEKSKCMMAEEGYRSFPYAISRYTQTIGEIYGRSPAMECLAAIKVLNEQQKTLLTQGHRALNPVLLAHDDGIVSSVKPGAVNVGGVNAEGRALVHALPTGNLSLARDLMDPQRAAINDAFLTSLFQILTDPKSGTTATEVLERTREKGILLSPTAGRQYSEYLGPLTEREIDVLNQQGLLPDMPPELVEAKGQYTIEYDSPLSRAAKAEEGAGLMRTIEMTLQVVNVTQNPEPLDFFDWNTIVPEVADMQAVPQRWINDLKAVEAIRAKRQEATDAQTAIQAGPAVAALAKAGAGAQ
jgi:hypothetical protein